jgi:hypothetical protein
MREGNDNKPECCCYGNKQGNSKKREAYNWFAVNDLKVFKE